MPTTTFDTTVTTNALGVYSEAGKSRGNKPLTFFYYLLATFLHLNLLIALNMTEIKTHTGKEKDKKEDLIIAKILPPPAEPPKIETPKPISQALTRMGNTNPGGGGGGGKMMIDDRLIDQIKSDNSEKLKDMTLEDLQKILPEKGEEDLAAKPEPEAAPQAKAKDITRSKTSRTQPVITLKKGYKYGIKKRRGDRRRDWFRFRMGR
ncbi:hypothetical protein HY745_03945 [Candidatus Desantisbacteria bacterium]|nr:hypothetical protein [Candidatus Desantisbacteria bacterium]